MCNVTMGARPFAWTSVVNSLARSMRSRLTAITTPPAGEAPDDVASKSVPSYSCVVGVFLRTLSLDDPNDLV